MTNTRVIMTEEQILTIANEREFFVHRFGERHEKLRKLTRRMCKDSKLRMVNQTSRGFTYSTPEAAYLDRVEREFALQPDTLCPEDM